MAGGRPSRQTPRQAGSRSRPAARFHGSLRRPSGRNLTLGSHADELDLTQRGPRAIEHRESTSSGQSRSGGIPVIRAEHELNMNNDLRPYNLHRLTLEISALGAQQTFRSHNSARCGRSRRGRVSAACVAHLLQSRAAASSLSHARKTRTFVDSRRFYATSEALAGHSVDSSSGPLQRRRRLANLRPRAFPAVALQSVPGRRKRTPGVGIGARIGRQWS